MAKQTIKHGAFWYIDAQNRSVTALRGETVDIPGDDDLERGERLDAFATAKDLVDGTPFAMFLAARRAALGESPVPELPDEPADSEQPDELEKPAANASRKDWAAYAASQGAPDEETAEQGGLTRDQLREKYGA
ncbi:hypothetical protein ACIA8K_07020 [Catenuloplanes sp. NPDC051500]|uniref:hypothetical protein n=1 Tax=Catenuloplanes sp. NPDC051500 TaxID=3363959 RepID=UPI0037B4FBB6